MLKFAFFTIYMMMLSLSLLSQNAFGRYFFGKLVKKEKFEEFFESSICPKWYIKLVEIVLSFQTFSIYFFLCPHQFITEWFVLVSSVCRNDSVISWRWDFSSHNMRCACSPQRRGDSTCWETKAWKLDAAVSYENDAMKWKLFIHRKNFALSLSFDFSLSFLSPKISFSIIFFFLVKFQTTLIHSQSVHKEAFKCCDVKFKFYHVSTYIEFNVEFFYYVKNWQKLKKLKVKTLNYCDLNKMYWRWGW